MNKADMYFSKLKEAKIEHTFSGDLCLLLGWSAAVIGLLSTLYMLFSGGSTSMVVGGFGITLILALMGAPIAAVGSQTNDARRRTEIAYLQAKYIEFVGQELDPYINPTEDTENA